MSLYHAVRGTCRSPATSAASSPTSSMARSASPATSAFVPLGTTARRKAELHGFFEAQLRLRRRPDIAGQADLAEKHASRGSPARERRNERRRGREIGRRLADLQAAGDVQIDIVTARLPRPARASSTARIIASRPLSQPTTARRASHSRAPPPAPALPPERGRVPSSRQIPPPPGEALLRSPRKSADGLATSMSPLPRHFEHADFVGRPEAVFHRAQHAEMMPALAFEIEHGIHQMFDRLGTCDLAIFGHMPHENECGARRFGVAHEIVGSGAHLRDRSRRGFQRRGPDRLDRVDGDDAGRRSGFERCERRLRTPVADASATGASPRPIRAARMRTCAIASSPEM